jgi:hypothetical protein
VKSFVTYLRSLVTRPLRKAREDATDLGRLVRILGELGDEARDAIYSVRRAWVVKTSPGGGLELHGDARKLWRLPDEAVEAYRTRLMAAFDTWQQGGTDDGVASALALVGLPDADVHGVHFSTPWQFNGQVRFDGTATFGGTPHWAWFEVIAPMTGGGASESQLTGWLSSIDRWKAGHARLRRLALDSANRMVDVWPVPVDQLGLGAQHNTMIEAWPMGSSGVRFDGTHAFDGTWAFGQAMDYLESHTETPT